MSKVTPIRIPVCNSAMTVIERVDSARARRLALAPNATAVYSRKRGAIVRIMLASDGPDELLELGKFGDPRKYTFLECSEQMPQGVHTLRHLPSSTEDLYCSVRTECMKKAA